MRTRNLNFSSVGLRSAQPLQQVVPVHVPVAGSILADGGTGAATPALSVSTYMYISQFTIHYPTSVYACTHVCCVLYVLCVLFSSLG